MKKNILFGLACFAFSGAVWAAPVTPQNAQKAALHFMQMETGNHAVSLKQFDYPQNEKYNQAAFYVFTTEQQPGFVIISADDAVRPVLGYSTNNGFAEVGNISPEVSYWLDWYAQQIYAVQQNNLKATDAIHEEWDNLMKEPDIKGGRRATEQKTTGVVPLLQTTWNQLPYYNDLCPAIPYVSSNPTYHAPAGCVATAMAQIMKYWETPTTIGTGSHSYNGSSLGGTLSANFGSTTYDWSNMPNNISASSSQAEKDAVATLMYHCGVAVEMDYDTNASGALVINYGYSNLACSQNAMTSYFGYSSSIKGYKREDFADSVWISMLKNELDNGRPVLYTGFGSLGGHAFDFDGYNSNEYFHVNWGWGGLSNGYFMVDNLSPSALGQGGGGGNFNSGQEVLMMIEPDGNSNTGDDNTGIENAAQNNAFKVFPNPAHNEIHVKATGDSETPESVQLMDVTGRMVYENKNLSGTDITIPVRGLSAGMYYLRLTTSKGSQIEKVSVQH